jgi:hypothetical protein
MPITLGILSQFRAAPAAAGSYELIETISVGSGGVASATFSGLSAYSSTYKHLQIRITGRSTTDGATIFGQFNADTGTNYQAHRLFGNGSSVVSDAFTTRDSLFLGATMFTTGGVANAFAASVVDILDPYVTTKFTTTRTLAGVPGGPAYVTLQSASWRNTAALTEIKLYPNLGSFAQFSRLSLYGIKG